MNATFDLQSASARLAFEQAVWMIKAFGRTSYRGMYVKDELQGKLLYVSDSFSFFCGGMRDAIMTRDVSFFEHCLTSTDRTYYDEVQRSHDEFMRGWSAEDIEKTILSMHLHIVSRRGMESLIHYQSTPLLVRTDGKILLTLCVFSLPSYSGQARGSFYDSSHGRLYEYSFSLHRWDAARRPILTENEKDVLSLSAQGLTLHDIAKQLCVTGEAVRRTRNRLFRKLNVHNIIEALNVATALHLI